MSNGTSGQAMGAVVVHPFPHLEHGVGLSSQMAELVGTVASLVKIPSGLIGGVLGDRLPKHPLFGGVLTLMALGYLVLGLAMSLSKALAFSVLYSVGWGVRTPIANAMQGEY